PVEKQQKSLRADLIRQNVKETHFNFGFHIPDVRHEDTPALDLLSMVLSHGESSRLNHRIKEVKGLVNSISAYSYTPKDPGIFVVAATLPVEKLQPALTESVKEIALLTHETVSAEELRRAKINILSEKIYEQETVQGQARKLGYYQAILNDL